VKCQANTLQKPVLDQGTFQQLLAAAYTLQQQNDRPVIEKPKLGSSKALPDGATDKEVELIPVVSLTSKPMAATELTLQSVLPIAESVAEPLAPLNDSVLPLETDAQVPYFTREILDDPSFEQPQSKPSQVILPAQHAIGRATSGASDRVAGRRISQGNELFWRAATVVAMAAVSALLGASINRFSPLPANLTLPSEVLQQQVPFRHAKRIMTVPAQGDGVGAKTMMEPPATKSGSIDRTAVGGEAPRRSATVTSARKTTAVRKRHSTHASETEMVAQDTVVRYGARSAARRAHVQIPIYGAALNQRY
jgi:hypothetical protein